MPGFVLLLILAATLGKVFGAGLAARMFGFNNRQAAAIGVAMNARGAIELVIADIALRTGIFSYPSLPPAVVAQLFSAVVIMAIATTLITPVSLRLIFSKTQKQ